MLPICKKRKKRNANGDSQIFIIMSNWNLLPVKDLKEHEESTTCECEPKVEFQENGDMLIIHNSFDGREAIEMFNKIINNKTL